VSNTLVEIISLVRICLCALIVIAHGAVTAFADDPVENIRPRDPVAILLLQTGMERSQTFRQLVQDLRQSNVIVYVDVRQEPGYGPSGSLTFTTQSHGWRWVRATIDTGTTDNASVRRNVFHLTEILGHELQHAREVIAASSMQNLDDFEAHLRRIGTSLGKHRFDTAAAVEIGRTVASELLGDHTYLVSDAACDAWSGPHSPALSAADMVRSFCPYQTPRKSDQPRSASAVWQRCETAKPGKFLRN
jgi:hypothetical protein